MIYYPGHMSGSLANKRLILTLLSSHFTLNRDNCFEQTDIVTTLRRCKNNSAFRQNISNRVPQQNMSLRKLFGGKGPKHYIRSESENIVISTSYSKIIKRLQKKNVGW